MRQPQVFCINRSGALEADRAGLSSAQIKIGIPDHNWYAVGTTFVDPFEVHTTGEVFSLERNIHDAIRLFKASRLSAEILGSDAHGKFIELKQFRKSSILSCVSCHIFTKVKS